MSVNTLVELAGGTPEYRGVDDPTLRGSFHYTSDDSLRALYTRPYVPRDSAELQGLQAQGLFFCDEQAYQLAGGKGCNPGLAVPEETCVKGFYCAEATNTFLGTTEITGADTEVATGNGTVTGVRVVNTWSPTARQKAVVNKTGVQLTYGYSIVDGTLSNWMTPEDEEVDMHLPTRCKNETYYLAGVGFPDIDPTGSGAAGYPIECAEGYYCADRRPAAVSLCNTEDTERNWVWSADHTYCQPDGETNGTPQGTGKCPEGAW